MKKCAWMSLLFLGLLLGGCATPPPGTFERFREPGWTATEIRQDVGYDRAWQAMVSLLVRKFDIEFLAKDEGYIRTAWLYNWTGIIRADYRVRASVMFSDDRRTVEIKPEAQHQIDGEWISGADSRLLPTLREDVIRAFGSRR